LKRTLRRSAYVANVAVRRKLGLSAPGHVAQVMHEFARGHPGAFVVQIGAHDASQLDPIRRYIVEKGWRGLLVEPIPEVFERLKANYAGIEGLEFENAAIAPQDGTMPLHYLPQTSEDGLPKWYDALASFRKDVLLTHKRFIPDIEERIRTMDVPSLTFESLCAKHGVRDVDVIQIDTEGYDFEIVKLVDLERFRPALIQVEELHFDDGTTRAFDAYVGAHGYETIGNGMDRIALSVDRLGSQDDRVRSLWRKLHGQGAT
jgi:FkbM family methyltransferase